MENVIIGSSYISNLGFSVINFFMNIQGDSKISNPKKTQFCQFYISLNSSKKYCNIPSFRIRLLPRKLHYENNFK